VRRTPSDHLNTVDRIPDHLARLFEQLGARQLGVVVVRLKRDSEQSVLLLRRLLVRQRCIVAPHAPRRHQVTQLEWQQRAGRRTVGERAARRVAQLGVLQRAVEEHRDRRPGRRLERLEQLRRRELHVHARERQHVIHVPLQHANQGTPGALDQLPTRHIPSA